MIFCYDFSLESQNMLIIKDLFKVKIGLNFSDPIFKTLKTNLYFH